MRAVVYRKPFDVAVEDVPEPKLEHPNDVLVRITSSCICGSDRHMYEGRFDRRVDGYTEVALHP
jgi:glutathione-independent formaldehyde dehydrogenase